MKNVSDILRVCKYKNKFCDLKLFCNMTGEFLLEGVEAGEVFGAESGHGCFDGGEGFALHGAGFGVEFIGIADEAFEFGLGDHLAESGSGVSFGYTGGPFRGSFAAEEGGA